MVRNSYKTYEAGSDEVLRSIQAESTKSASYKKHVLRHSQEKNCEKHTSVSFVSEIVSFQLLFLISSRLSNILFTSSTCRKYAPIFKWKILSKLLRKQSSWYKLATGSFRLKILKNECWNDIHITRQLLTKGCSKFPWSFQFNLMAWHFE